MLTAAGFYALSTSKSESSFSFLEEASKSLLREKHGCVIVRGGEILARGHNKYVAQVTYYTYPRLPAEPSLVDCSGARFTPCGEGCNIKMP